MDTASITQYAIIKGYHGDIMGISWAYHGDIMGISWGYHGDIKGISLGYHGDIMGISRGYHRDIMEISWRYHGDVTGPKANRAAPHCPLSIGLNDSWKLLIMLKN